MTFEQFVDALNRKLEPAGFGPVSDPETGFARWDLGDIAADISPEGGHAAIGVHRDGEIIARGQFPLDSLGVDHAVRFLRDAMTSVSE